jgi:hypothetical protein
MSNDFTTEELEALRRLARSAPVADAVLSELSRDPESAREQMRALLKLSDISLPLSKIIRKVEAIQWAISFVAWLVGGFLLSAAAIVQAANLIEWLQNLRDGKPH